MDDHLVFGPVPSRRLGRSLGINNIPPKTCTYACIYCQLGTAAPVPPGRQPFYDPGQILAQVRVKLETARAAREPIDYLTIVSDGEPTLDRDLGRLIDHLRPLGLKIAVITNASLLSCRDVRQDLCRADWVSVKVDTLDPRVWRRIDRGHIRLAFTEILGGITAFAKAFSGCLVTETMLVRGVNDGDDSLEKTADFIGPLDPAPAYLSIPTRPPAVPGVMPPDASGLNRAWQIFSGRGIETETLIGYEGNQFACTGDLAADILSITAVHPMREDAVWAYLETAGQDVSAVERLVRENRLRVLEYNGERFYIRALPTSNRRR